MLDQTKLDEIKQLDIYNLYTLLADNPEVVTLLVKSNFFYEEDIVSKITNCLHPYYYYSIKKLIQNCGISFDFTILERSQILNEKQQILTISDKGVFKEIEEAINYIKECTKEKYNYTNNWLRVIPKYLNGSFITLCHEYDDERNGFDKKEYNKFIKQIEEQSKLISAKILFEMISNRHFDNSLENHLDTMLQSDLIQFKKNRLVIHGIKEEDLNILNTLYNLNEYNEINKSIYNDLYEVDKTDINKCFGISDIRQLAA